MFNRIAKQSKMFFSSLTYSKKPNLSSSSFPQFSISIFISVLYYVFVLLVLYNQMFLLFERAPVPQLIHQKEKSPIIIETGEHINITLKYSIIPQKLSKQRIQSICQRVYITNSQTLVKFKTSILGDCIIQSQNYIKLNEIILNTNDMLFDIPVEVSFKKSNGKFQVILANISKNSLNILNIIIDSSVEFIQNDIFPFTLEETKVGINKSPEYELIQAQNTTSSSRQILKISSSKISNTKFSSQFRMVDLVSNISTIVLLIYFSSLFLFFDFISKNSYLQLASRLFILKYNTNNQIVYENINPSVCQNIKCSKYLSEDLKNKAIQKIIEKIDISNMIKQVKNLQILVNQKQAKINIHNIKRTITTMNPYDLRKIQKQKILQYMQLEDIKINETQFDIFSSPLMVSIAHKLTHRQSTNFLDNFSEQKQQQQTNLEQLLIQLPKNQGNIIIKIFKKIGYMFNKILEKVDIFTYRVGFFFDQHQQNLLSPFTGFFTSIKIWLFIILCYSTISSFISYKPQSIMSEKYSQDYFDHGFSEPLYLFAHNITSGQYLSLSQIYNISTVSYNVQDKSYILSPINQNNANNLQNTEWNNCHGGVFQFDSKLNSKNNTFSIEMEYICSSNTDCEKQFQRLFSINFYLVLPSFKMQGQNKIEQQLIPYNFKYQYQAKKLQHITLTYQMSSHVYDKSIIPNNNNQRTLLQFKKDESSTTYKQLENAMTIIDFKLSNRVINRRSIIMQIDQFIGFLGAIWIILGGLFCIIQQFITKVQIQISLQGQKVSWLEIIYFIFIRIFTKNNKISRITQESKQLFSLQKTIQRMSIIQNYIHTYQFSPYRTILNIYTKKQLQSFFQKPNNKQRFDFPDLSTIQTKQSPKIQNMIINHYPNINSNGFMKFLFTNLNKINIFDFTPKLCLKGKSKISSKTSKLLSIIILIIVGFLILSNIQSFGNNTIVQQQPSIKISGIEEKLSQQFQLCINFKSQNKQLEALVDDYLLLLLKQNQNQYKLLKSSNDLNYCVQDKFKKQQFKDSSPFYVTININPQKMSPNFQQYYSKILHESEYSLCMTNYYFSSSKNTSIFSSLQCFQNLSLKSKVIQTTTIKLHWNIIQNSGFYNFKSFENKYKYEVRDLYSQQYLQNIDKQFITFQFIYTEGIQQIIVQQSVMTLLKKILGLILIVVLLKPLISKYNETKFVLELSKQFFLVQGQILQLTFYDVLKFIFLSVFKLRKFMTRRNRILMRSYLNTRKLLSYKDFLKSISTLQTILKKQSDQSLQILLKTYIKSEIYLQQNIDKGSANLKLSILHELKSKHLGIYQKLINMGLNNNEILILIGLLQKQKNKKNKQLNQKLQEFQQYLGIQ